jgi:hypothetical protein
VDGVFGILGRLEIAGLHHAGSVSMNCWIVFNTGHCILKVTQPWFVAADLGLADILKLNMAGAASRSASSTLHASGTPFDST